MNLKFSKDKEMGKNCTFGTIGDRKKTSTRATLRELKKVKIKKVLFSHNSSQYKNVNHVIE